MLMVAQPWLQEPATRTTFNLRHYILLNNRSNIILQSTDLMWSVVVMWSVVMWSELTWFMWSDFVLKWSVVMWSELTWFMWSDFVLKWSEVSYGEVFGTKVPCTLWWPYTEGTGLYCDYSMWCVFCAVVVLTGFVMCGCVYVWIL